MSEWQPIETAPYGQKALMWFPDFDAFDIGIKEAVEGCAGVQVDEYVDQWNNEPFETGIGQLAYPTHWMPLPDPPEAA